MIVDCKALTAAANIMLSVMYLYHVASSIPFSISELSLASIFGSNFSVLLAFFCLSYALSDFLEMFCTSAQLFDNVEDNVVKIIKKLGELFYVYASPCAVLLVVERAIATLYSVQYEQLQPWSVFWMGQVFCVIFAFLVVFCQFWIEFNYNIQQWSLLAIQLAIISSLTVLLILNYIRKKRLLGSGLLRSRYQTAENINVLRISVQVILLDAAVTLLDISFESLFSVKPVFEPEKCGTSGYVALFIVSQMLRDCAEALIPISILVLHPCIKKMININFRWCQIGKFSCINKTASSTVISGVQISDIYFNNLRVMWNK
uniref:Serpentine Receptor, class BC (Class B-like) n=1 Tax=Angiostrongylus cantonensis TaxID=6313 RepID=A0A158P8J4_ANGCA